MALREFPYVVIGAGAAGLVVAIGLAKAGKKVLLIESGNYGGDCTNFGCIPSKSLIAASHVAHCLRNASSMGIQAPLASFDAQGALERVRTIVAEIREKESPKALLAHGVETLTGKAAFIDKKTLEVHRPDDETENIRGKTIILATGSFPFVPGIPGLEEIDYLTNETIFALPTIPDSLTVLGGGPIGCELGQTFQRLGSRVQIVGTRPVLIPRDEPEAQQVLREQFEKEKIRLFLGYQTEAIHKDGDTIALHIRSNDKKDERFLTSTQLLISVGRRPNIRTLNLDAAGVKHTRQGISIDMYGRTSQKHIWAVGDCAGPPFYTHMAEAQARAVLTTLVTPFFYKAKVDRSASVPHVTYTDPEIARLGPTRAELEEQYPPSKLHVYHVPFSAVDRAITTGETNGFIQITTKKWSSQILGATVVGSRSGEMLCQLATAKKARFPLRKLASVIHPYPTFSLGIRKAADQWLVEVLLPALQKKRTIPWARFLPILVIVLLMMVSWWTGLTEFFRFDQLRDNRDWLVSGVENHPILSPILYIALYILITTLSIPGAVFVTIGGGFLFPQPWSTIYTVVGATVGATFLFLAARTAFGQVLREKAGPFLQKMEKGFQENAASYLLFLRLIPLFPFWLVNLAPALFGVSVLTFIWTTFVGIIPGTFVYTHTGHGLNQIFASGEEFSLRNVFNWDIIIALTALGIFALLPTLYRWWRARKKGKISE